MKTPVLYTATLAALLTLGGSAWAQQAPAGDPTNKAPLQAQELATLVPKDSSQPQPADISRANTTSQYHYDRKGVNCSLYPARCRGGNP
jgi:hypothetical protein